MKVRYFTTRPGRNGPRYFWQPAAALQAQGWKLERLPDDKPAAVARAEQLNAELDAWRAGSPLSSSSRADGGVAPPTEVGQASRAAAGGARSHNLKPYVQPRTMAHLIRDYEKSRFFTEKAPATRDSYKLNMKIIEAWAGDFQVAAIGPARVQKLYESLYKATPSKASHVVAVLRILLQHAVRLEWVRSNAAEKPGTVGQPFAGKLWPQDAVDLLVEVADRKTAAYPQGRSSIGTAVLVNHWLGQREADVLKLTRAAYRDGTFFITQNKTAARVAVPHSPEVALRIEQEKQRQKARGIESAVFLILCEATGQPWDQKKFQVAFAELRADAARIWPAFFGDDDTELAFTDLDFRHLRHTAVTELGNAGATDIEIAAITGHTLSSVKAILERYLVRTATQAGNATAKRLAARALFGAGAIIAAAERLTKERE